MPSKLTVPVRWTSNVRITARDLNGCVLDVVERKNLIVNVGLNMVRDALDTAAFDAEIKRIALGTDNTPPLLTDTQLGAEVFRKVVTSSSTPATGQLNTVWYIAPAEAVAAIEEIGWFAGAAAGAAANSGILVARVLYSRNKTALESLQIERLDAFTEA